MLLPGVPYTLSNTLTFDRELAIVGQGGQTALVCDGVGQGSGGALVLESGADVALYNVTLSGAPGGDVRVAAASP